MAGYYVITKRAGTSSGDDDVYQVWERTGGESRGRLRGEYSSLTAAKAALDVVWHEAASPGIRAWGFSTDDVVLEVEHLREDALPA